MKCCLQCATAKINYDSEFSGRQTKSNELFTERIAYVGSYDRDINFTTMTFIELIGTN